MEKSKTYSSVRFNAEALKEAVDVIRSIAKRLEIEIDISRLTVEHDDSTWRYDKIEEFLADYRKYKDYAYFSVYGRGLDLTASMDSIQCTINVKAPERADIETVFDVFEKNVDSCRLPLQASKPVVFIGHGSNKIWRDLKDHLQDKHGIQIVAYETGARAGHAIRDILQEMVSKSSFAILVLTGDDEQADRSVRARQNVIHETGLFQGRLGFSRAILLLEEGVEDFSNMDGIQHIKFAKGNIKETFGEVLATLRREFPASSE
jgi:predicted nucleotide-binding protein